MRRSIVPVKSEPEFQVMAIYEDSDRAWILPKPKTTAQWLAYIAIDMHQNGKTLKQIGRYIDSIPGRIKNMKKKGKKKCQKKIK